MQPPLPTLILSLLSLLTLPTTTAAATEPTVHAAYIFHRHGDRTPKTLPNVHLTPLGHAQCYQSGSFFHSRYIDPSSPLRIPGLSYPAAQLSQLRLTAPKDAVLQASAAVWAMSLYPPLGGAGGDGGGVGAEVLGNGSTVSMPLGGVQVVPVDVPGEAGSTAGGGGSEGAEWLQGQTQCAAGMRSSKDYWASGEFSGLERETRGFYAEVRSAVGGLEDVLGKGEVSYRNAYVVWDLINVGLIHPQTFTSGGSPTNLSTATLTKLFHLASQHEFSLAFNSSSPVRAMPGKLLAGHVLNFFNSTVHGASASSETPPPPKLSVQFGPYASFLSFFGLANLPPRSIPNYASALAWELIGPPDAAADPARLSVRLFFSNGSTAGLPDSAGIEGRGDGGQQLVPLVPLGSGPVATMPYADFVRGMAAFAVRGEVDWCAECGNAGEGVCAAYSAEGRKVVGAGAGGESGRLTPAVAAGIGVVSVLGAVGVAAVVARVMGFIVVRKGAVVRVKDLGGE